MSLGKPEQVHLHTEMERWITLAWMKKNLTDIVEIREQRGDDESA